MKGVVFKELIGMVESVFGEDTAEKIIDKAQLPSNGAYTSVGTYDHSEILALVTQLSTETQTPASQLIQAFGRHLASVFKDKYPTFFNAPSAFDFFQSVDGIIHVEVRKLYPDAELPRFVCERPTESTLIMNYSSSRPFADLAQGLIEGVLEFYGEEIELTSEDTSNGAGNSRKFIMEKAH